MFIVDFCVYLKQLMGVQKCTFWSLNAKADHNKIMSL